MPSFLITAKSNVPLPNGLHYIPQFQQAIISVGYSGVTSTTLFTNRQSQEILAQQMNFHFGTGDFFNKDNVLTYSGYFAVKLI